MCVKVGELVYQCPSILMDQLLFVWHHVLALPYNAPKTIVRENWSCWLTRLFDWPWALLKGVSDFLNCFSWRASSSLSGTQTSFLLKSCICIVRLSGGCYANLIRKLLLSCTRLILIKLQDKNTFSFPVNCVISEAAMKKSVKFTLNTKSKNINCDITTARQDQSSRKLERFRVTLQMVSLSPCHPLYFTRSHFFL